MRTSEASRGPILPTAAEMRALEATAIASGAVTGAHLMVRAASALVSAALANTAGSGRALVLCGPGNNGGDGYVAAGLLADRGWSVRLLALAPPVRAAQDACAAAAEWAGRGQAGVLDLATVEAEGAVDLVIDAVFGTGIARPLGGDLCAALAAAGQAAGRVVAADAPSGLCLDTGRVRAPGGILPLAADLTVAFHAAKPGHFLGRGPDVCGRLRIVDIGLPDVAVPPEVTRQALPDAGRLAKAAEGHKYAHGHALVLAGGAGRGGAARLAARAALRVGAGLVTLGCPPDALGENAARLDAVMLHPVAGATALAEWLQQEARITALCLGPGLGLDPPQADLVAAALAARRPTVLDADALTLVARTPALLAALHRDCVLTPHEGEFARLFPALARALDTADGLSRLEAVRTAAAQTGSVVLLKGRTTVIACPTGATLLHPATHARRAPWLATAGAGDVLAGLIAGLLARGWPAPEAAGTATWLHVEAARRIGPGLIAEDLPDALPGVFRALGI
ncbi:MAG: NAD(P)H-hydrate dehydratase [Alkalilacustris sp.]